MTFNKPNPLADHVRAVAEIDRRGAEIGALKAEIERLRSALEKATQKLQIFRAATDGEYTGGMEYTALMREIAAALNEQKQKT